MGSRKCLAGSLAAVRSKALVDKADRKVGHTVDHKAVADTAGRIAVGNQTVADQCN